MPKKNTFRRKSLISQFVEIEHGAKNHKEFIAGQSQKPVALYGRPAG